MHLWFLAICSPSSGVIGSEAYIVLMCFKAWGEPLKSAIVPTRIMAACGQWYDISRSHFWATLSKLGWCTTEKHTTKTLVKG